ncbi:FAD-binding protein [Streptomyces antimicrobicus]|uniref:FAD-binding protein n=1 Tax=Streptomyces antimicrobicus TaxID=2883108 RepID=A0ABS8B1S1_9ACTN|nr:FAD-binding protein [Streptomyces antimicrobicus]MCB5178553.1 FAD-binding protein [Streptomyces antimicrobicus]
MSSTPRTTAGDTATQPSRRGLLRGAAAAAVAVVGWNAVDQTWATAAEAGKRDVVPVPNLVGTLETSDATVSAFSHDFGHFFDNAKPWAVLRPGCVQDIVTIVNYARVNGIKVAVNGQGGTGTDLESHSVYGQARVPGGISIDAKGISKILSIGNDYAVVEAGVTWGQLTDATLALGKTPPALPDYLYISIGGTLSVGGIGGTVQKHGLMVDTVQAIDIVTADGKLVTATPWLRADLFNAALAGAGQVGIIVRVNVKLVPAPKRAVVFSLFYADLETYLADSEKVMAEGRFQVHAGEMLQKPDGSGWRYKMEVGATYDTTAPDRDRLLAGLRDVRSDAVIEDVTFRDYMFRLDAYEAYLKSSGHWYTPKPWLSMFLPASKTKTFMQLVERELTADSLGGGFLLFYPYYTSKIRRPLAVQPAESVGYLFDLLRFPNPGDTGVQAMLDQNRRLYDIAVSMGAKRYLVGSIPNMTQADWKAHYGNRWAAFAYAKKKYDPTNIFTPGQGIFT